MARASGWREVGIFTQQAGASGAILERRRVWATRATSGGIYGRTDFPRVRRKLGKWVIGY